MKVLILKKRRDFIRAAKGYKSIVSGLILQAAQSLSAPHKPLSDDICYIGYTATKKIGKAHLRNRAKRRLRAAAAKVFPQFARARTDYVLIARYNTVDIEFAALVENLRRALERVNADMAAHAAKAVS